MIQFDTADRLHRLVKKALDSGEAASLAEAEAMFADYRLSIALGDDEASDSHWQTALLTTVSLAKRVFLGGVTVRGSTDVPLATPLPFGATLSEAIQALGGTLTDDLQDGVPTISISCNVDFDVPFQIRPVFSGWRGGIVPATSAIYPDRAPVMPLAPMLAAALAVNEAFLFVSGELPVAGRRAVGLSLWNPVGDWLARDQSEPCLEFLPSRIWLIGLGHLGQAYLWALGLLPYANPSELSLVLQDFDIITPSTESTSILSSAAQTGQKKSRAMAAWAERRGFMTSIQERVFDSSFRRRSDEPCVAMCGLDNALGRRALDQVGFEFVVEAGLGRGHHDFRAIRLHTLPASRAAREIWNIKTGSEELRTRPAYDRMLREGELDQCGVTLLAGKAVGAPFVGAVAGALAVSEILRLFHGGTTHELIDIDLKQPDYRTAVISRQDFSNLNPGYTRATGGVRESNLEVRPDVDELH